MKLLYYLNRWFKPIPGAQKAAKDLLEAIIKENVNIEFHIVSDRVIDPNLNDISHKRYKLYEIFRMKPPNLPGLDHYIHNYIASHVIHKIANKIKPDIIHFQVSQGFCPIPPSNFLSIATFHDEAFSQLDTFSKGPLKYLEYLWYNRARSIRMTRIPYFQYYHVLSSNAKRALQEMAIPKERILVLLNGVRKERPISSKHYLSMKSVLDAKLGLGVDTFYLLVVGKLEFLKGIHNLVSALEFLPSNYHLILAGQPSLVSKQYLRSLFLSNHRNRIHWLGYLNQKELFSLFKATHYYVSSSLSEGCQLSVLDALYTGMPVILTNVGAASDIFGDLYPFLVRSHDPKVLAEKIVEASREGVSPTFTPNVQTWSEIGRQMGKFYNDIYRKK